MDLKFIESSLSKHFEKSKTWFLLSILIIATSLWVLGYSESYFNNPDAFDYAQMGREIYNGHGFTTLQIFPRHLPFIEKSWDLNLNNGHWPNLYRYPLPTLAHAAFQFLFDDAVEAAIIQSGFWFLITVPLIFALAIKLTDSVIALLSTLIFLADGTRWASAYNGMTETLAVFIIVLSLFIAFYETTKAWKWILLGALCGLALLTRTQLYFLFPFVIYIAWVKLQTKSHNRTILWISLGFFVVISPWALRNFVITGDPFFSFSTSRILVIGTVDTHSDLEMQLHAPTEIFKIIDMYGNDIWNKFLRNIWPEITNPIAIVGNAFYALLCVIIIFSSIVTQKNNRSRNYKLFKWWVLSLIFVNFFTISLSFPNSRFYELFYPLIPIITFQEIFILIERFGSKIIQQLKIISALIMVIGCLLWISITFQGIIINSSKPTAGNDQQSFEILLRITGDKSIIASDISHKISLYNKNPTLRLPAFPTELLEINSKYMSIDYVLISKKIAQSSSNEGTPSIFENYSNYNHFIETRSFTTLYELVIVLPNGSKLYSLIES